MLGVGHIGVRRKEPHAKRRQSLVGWEYPNLRRSRSERPGKRRSIWTIDISQEPRCRCQEYRKMPVYDRDKGMELVRLSPREAEFLRWELRIPELGRRQNRIGMEAIADAKVVATGGASDCFINTTFEACGNPHDWWGKPWVVALGDFTGRGFVRLPIRSHFQGCTSSPPLQLGHVAFERRRVWNHP